MTPSGGFRRGGWRRRFVYSRIRQGWDAPRSAGVTMNTPKKRAPENPEARRAVHREPSALASSHSSPPRWPFAHVGREEIVCLFFCEALC